MTESEVLRLYATVEGIVQGVGFRSFVQQNAAGLGLTGWTRNRWDGTVEVVAEGPKKSLERLLTLLYRGPRGSTITGVDPEWQAATGEFRGFQIRLTSG